MQHPEAALMEWLELEAVLGVQEFMLEQPEQQVDLELGAEGGELEVVPVEYPNGEAKTL